MKYNKCEPPYDFLVPDLQVFTEFNKLPTVSRWSETN